MDRQRYNNFIGVKKEPIMTDNSLYYAEISLWPEETDFKKEKPNM